VKANLILLSIGLVLTTATQLRLGSLPVGPGEALLAIWAVVSWVEIVGRKDIRVPVDIRPFLYFFSAVVIMLCLSLIYQIGSTRDPSANAFHDLGAYLFVGGLVLTFGFLRRTLGYLRPCLKIITTSLILSLAVLLVISKFLPSIGPILLHNGFRFLGWAENPNQLGMALVPAPFLCAIFIREATTLLGRAGYACCLALALWVGLETISDALQLAWLVGTILVTMATLMAKTIGRVHSAYLITNLFAIGLLGLLLLIVPFGTAIYDKLAEGDDGGASRPPAWKHAVAAIYESPIVGHGPGSQDLGHEVIREAHNSYLDLALAAGLIGVGAAVWLSGSLVLRPSLIARPALWSAFMAMQCFIMFHYIFRHPLFWFYAILMTSLAYQEYAIRRQAQPQPALRQAGLGPQRA
jgi:O-antigen ligase